MFFVSSVGNLDHFIHKEDAVDISEALIYLLIGGVLMAGAITALPNHISDKLTTQDRFGWWMIVIGLTILGLMIGFAMREQIVAAFLILWNGTTWAMAVTFLGGVIVLLLGIGLVVRQLRK